MCPKESVFRKIINRVTSTLSAPLLRPGTLEGDLGKGVGGDEGTGVTALYTHLRVSLDCYPLVTPLG